MDGPITSYPGSTTTSIYATMRRGGRMLYAFAMQNSDPSNITLSWAVGCMTDTSCSSGFSGIGQTWSPAKILKASYNSGTAPLLIMGGGYDTCEDADPNNCTSSSKGSQIYVLDLATGAVRKLT